MAPPTNPPARWSSSRPWLRSPSGWPGVALGALVAAALVAFFISESFYPHAPDFNTFYSAGYAIRHPEIPLYDLVLLDEDPFGEVFKLPPSAAMYMAPLSLLRPRQARLVWRLLLVASLFCGYLLLMRELQVPVLSWAWLGGMALWALYGPAQIAVGEGQWDPLFLLLLVVVVAGARQSRQVVAGVALAAAASVKPYPLLIAGFFVARRWWRGLAALLLALGMLVGLGALAAGLEETTAFVARALPASGAATPYPDNQALGGVLARIAQNDFRPRPLRTGSWVDPAVRIVALGALGATMWLVGRRAGDDPAERVLQVCLFVPLSILVLPAAWSHYGTILLIPLTVLAADLGRRRSRAWLGWGVLVLASVLLAIPNPTMLYGPELNDALWERGGADAANAALRRAYPTEFSRLVFSYKALATALLFGVLAWRVGLAPSRGGDRAVAREASVADETARGLARTATGVGS